MISHGWTYQALVHDCLQMKLNRVTVVRVVNVAQAISPKYSQEKPQKTGYDLDSKDFFWAKNASKPFPQVAEDIDVELNRCVLTLSCTYFRGR